MGGWERAREKSRSLLGKWLSGLLGHAFPKELVQTARTKSQELQGGGGGTYTPFSW